MSDAGRVNLFSLEETTLGTTPSSAMATVAGATSVTGGIDPQVVRSNVIRSDYINPHTIRVGNAGSKAVNFEHQYGDVPSLNWLEGVLRSDWTAPASVTATDISFVAADNSINSTAETLTVFPKGSFLRVAGTNDNNGLHQVEVSTTAKLTMSDLTTIVDESAGSSFTLDNDGILRNGSTLKGYTLELNFTDVSSTPFLTHPGLRPAGYTLDIPTGGLVTGTCNFQGMPPIAPAAATAGTGAATAKSTTRTMSGASDISTILEGGSAVTAHVTQLSLNLSSPVRLQYELGELPPWGVGGNKFELAGSMTVYNDANGLAIWEKLRADTPTSLYYRLTDEAGNIEQYSMPSLRYVSGNADVSDPQSDVMLQMGFAIDYDATFDFLFGVDKFAA